MTYQNGPILKENQKQTLYGTILGGSSIIKPDRGKNCYLAMRDNNKLWLDYKIEVLSERIPVVNLILLLMSNGYEIFPWYMLVKNFAVSLLAAFL